MWQPQVPLLRSKRWQNYTHQQQNGIISMKTFINSPHTLLPQLKSYKNFCLYSFIFGLVSIFTWLNVDPHFGFVWWLYICDKTKRREKILYSVSKNTQYLCGNNEKSIVKNLNMYKCKKKKIINASNPQRIVWRKKNQRKSNIQFTRTTTAKPRHRVIDRPLAMPAVSCPNRRRRRPST